MTGVYLCSHVAGEEGQRLGKLRGLPSSTELAAKLLTDTSQGTSVQWQGGTDAVKEAWSP